MATLPDLLKEMVALQGSDLHLSIGSPPQTRVHGELQRMNHAELTATDTKALSYAVLTLLGVMVQNQSDLAQKVIELVTQVNALIADDLDNRQSITALVDDQQALGLGA